jgi:phosphonate transport system substrate-binding protein
VTSSSTKASLTLTFGVYQTDKPSEVYRQFRPVVDALSRALKTHYGSPVAIDFKSYGSYDGGLNAIVQGEVDMMRLGPASYVLAKRKEPGVQLLVMEEKKGKRRFKGVIAVRTDSSYKTLAELKGIRFAFGNENSTIGRYLAQDELIRAGIFAADLPGSKFLGRHDKVAKAVQLGDFEAGSLKMSTFKKMNGNGDLRILKDFDNVTKPWVARAGLAPRLVEALRQGLLEMQDEKALKALRVSGFGMTSDEEYSFVREAMERAEASFGELTGP